MTASARSVIAMAGGLLVGLAVLAWELRSDAMLPRSQPPPPVTIAVDVAAAIQASVPRDTIPVGPVESSPTHVPARKPPVDAQIQHARREAFRADRKAEKRAWKIARRDNP